MAIETTLCYIEQGDAYLMLHRTLKKNDVNHGKWIGVGGKFEADESPEDCMRREVLEETGLEALRWRYRGIVTFVSPRSETEYMHLFTIDAWRGALHACNEGELAWMQKARLFDLPHWKGDEIFLTLIADAAQPFFSLKLVYDGDDTLTGACLDGMPVNLALWE